MKRYGWYPHLQELGVSKADILSWHRLRREFRAAARVCGFCGFVFTADSPCQLDHRVPHRGDRRLLLDPTNLMPLCSVCHNSVKRRMENGTARVQTGLDGYPVK